MIQVPEIFLDAKETLTLKNLTMLHYFNRKESKPIAIKINQHLLLHIFHGSKIMEYEDTRVSVSADETLFISRGSYIMSEILSFEEGCFDGVMVFFDDAFLIEFFAKYAQLFKDTPKDTQKYKRGVALVQKNLYLQETMHSINSYIQHKQEDKFLLQLKFEEALLQAIQNDKTNQLRSYLTDLYEDSLLHIKHIFDTEEFMDVESMIKRSKLSEEKFRKLFYQFYKQTPKEWLIQKRLAKAKLLLQEGTLNVSQVALECNFSSLSWFITQFNRYYKLTPKQFQQNHKKSKQN